MTSDSTEARFDNLASLHATHLEMLGRQSPRSGESLLLDAAEVKVFLGRAQATGADLADPEERAIAQRILDYWSADLLSSGRDLSTDCEEVTLAPFVSNAGELSGSGQMPNGPVPSGPQPAPKAAEVRSPDDARQFIRVASLARQWRDTKAGGYLLSGEALEKARRFAYDPDIAKLVVASAEAEQHRENQRSRIKNWVMLVMALMMAALIWSAHRAEQLAEEAKESERQAQNDEAEAKAQAQVASQKSEELTRANDQLAALLSSEQEQRKAADARFLELAARQRLLDAAVTALVEALADRTISLSDIPTELRDEVLASLAARIHSEDIPLYRLAPEVAMAIRPQQMQDMTLTAFETSPAGFQDGLSEPSPVSSVLPDLPETLRTAAYDGGAPVPYLNYSLVLDAERRVAVYAAASFDRLQRTVLPAGPVFYALDPRLPTAVQPDPRRHPDLLARGLRIAELVGRDDIAWGLEGSDAALVDRMVQVYPNTVPVLPAVDEGWQEVSGWVRAEHNPGASRITILSGPVLPPGTVGDPGLAALWKIAVSVQDLPQKQAAGASTLIVDAFVIGAAAGRAAVGPERYRTTVAEIARRTGLIFPPEVVAADQGVMLLNMTEGDRLAAAVRSLGGALTGERPALAQQLTGALRDDGAGPEDQAKIVAALLEGLGSEQHPSATDGPDLIFVLSQVPRATWDRQDWLPLKASARRAVQVLEARQIWREMEVRPDIQLTLDQLKRKLGLGDPPLQTVYLQFDGLTREAARSLGADLSAVGWKIPGEERVATAAGLRQVRYNPDNAADAAAARLLAADIATLGFSGMTPVPVGMIRPGILEIWIGEI